MLQTARVMLLHTPTRSLRDRRSASEKRHWGLDLSRAVGNNPTCSRSDLLIFQSAWLVRTGMSTDLLCVQTRRRGM
jgi:hypothetical protein